MKHLPWTGLFVVFALAVGGCADRGAGNVEGSSGGSGEASTGGGNGENSGTGSTTDDSSQDSGGDAGEDPGNSGGYPCDEEGARFCEIDAAYECQDGQWVFVQNCLEPLTCATDSGTCVEKVCDRGDRRCVDGATVQFCKPDQTGWLDPQPCGDAQACVENACVGAECYPGVMFLVDRSTSMGNSWTNVRNSIDTVVQANPSVRFGLTVFPSDADPADGLFGSLSGCPTGYDWPNISLQTNPGSTFTDFFNNNGVKGATPLASALEHVAMNVRDYWPEGQGGYLVVLSDGADTCTGGDNCSSACVATKLATSARALREQNVKTYVIGYNYTDDPIELNAIAQNGGTSFNEYVFAGGESLLTGVFQEFLLEIKECQ